MVFIDRINDDQPTPQLGPIEATNPCGEQPLLPFESCTLGSIDVGQFVGGRRPRLGAAAAVDPRRRPVPRRRDRREPLPAPRDRARDARRPARSGSASWAGPTRSPRSASPYDADAALALAERDRRRSSRSSRWRPRARSPSGAVPFPAWAGSRWASGRRAAAPLRNATTTTIAPTGTISIIAGCSSGIEPLYALAYRRNVLDGAELTEVNPAFQRLAAERGFALARAVRRGRRARRRPRHAATSPTTSSARFPTAHEIDVATHVRMQAAFQRHVHAAVSKTINLRRERDCRRRESCVPARVRAGLQGNHRLPGRQPRGPGARHRCDARARCCAAPSCPECGSVLVVQTQLPVVPALRLVGLRLTSRARAHSKREAAARSARCDSRAVAREAVRRPDSVSGSGGRTPDMRRRSGPREAPCATSARARARGRVGAETTKPSSRGLISASPLGRPACERRMSSASGGDGDVPGAARRPRPRAPRGARAC